MLLFVFMQSQIQLCTWQYWLRTIGGSDRALWLNTNICFKTDFFLWINVFKHFSLTCCVFNTQVIFIKFLDAFQARAFQWAEPRARPRASHQRELSCSYWVYCERFNSVSPLVEDRPSGSRHFQVVFTSYQHNTMQRLSTSVFLLFIATLAGSLIAAFQANFNGGVWRF